MYRSLNYQEFLFTNMVRRLMENALVLFQPMHNEAEQICYNSRKALGSDIQITEERPNSLMCKKMAPSQVKGDQIIHQTL